MHNKVDIYNDPANPDNKYFDITVSYNPNGQFFQELTYESTQTIPVVNKASDYYCSVIRFNIPLNFLPVTIFPVIPNTNNLALSNTSTIKVGIMNFTTGISYELPLQYENPSPTTVKPLQNKPTQVVTPYYFVYSYYKMLNIINDGIQAVFDLFAAANPTDPRVINGVNPLPAPFFLYDPETSLIRLITFNTWIQPLQIPPTPKTGVFLYINLNGINFLDAFDYFSIRTSPANLNFYFVVQDRGNNGYPVNTYPALSDYIYQIQSYSTIGNWASIKKILLTTNTMPVVNENLPLINNANVDQSNSLSVLSDFLPQINTTSPTNPRENAIYYPTSQYRLIDMISDLPLRKIDVSVYWQDKDNNIYPVFISQFSSASIKLAFVKKSLYKGGLSLMK